MSHRIAGLRNDRNGRQALISFSKELVTFRHKLPKKHASLLIFLAAGAVVNSCLELCVYVVRYGGPHQDTARWSRVVLVANIVLTSGAVIVAGHEGARMSMVFIGFARGLLCVWRLVKRLGLRPSHMFLGRMDADEPPVPATTAPRNGPLGAAA